jgi:hypothetical protein
LNEVAGLVNRKKDDPGRTPGVSQMFRDKEATYIPQINVQKNDIWLEVRGFFKR